MGGADSRHPGFDEEPESTSTELLLEPEQPEEREDRTAPAPRTPPPPPRPRQRTQSTPPPPPPPQRQTAPPPPPQPPAATPSAPPSQQGSRRTQPLPPVRPENEIWKIEMQILKRDATAMRERDPQRAALLYGAVSRIAAMLGDDLGAASALHESSELSSDRFVPMLSRRDALLARQFTAALELMRKELPQVGDPRERVALLLEIASIEELVQNDRNAARKALEEAREIDPAHTGVLEALAEIYLEGGDHERLVAVLGQMADATVDVSVRSMLRHASGLVHDVSLGNPIAARAAYKLALADDPGNLPAAVSLESLALLQEDWGELARVLVAESDLIGEARVQRRLCERAGDLYWERLGDAESAIAAYKRAARATPDEVAPLRKLGAVLESIGRWRELVEVYQEELPLLRDPEERADLYFRMGEVHEHHLNRIDDAAASYQAALEAQPSHLPTLQALGALFRSAERWAELAQMDLRDAEKMADVSRRADRYYEVADLVEHRIGDEAEAVRLYERAFDLAPGKWAAFDALDRLYRREERWSDLVRLYERKAQSTKDPPLLRFLRQEAGRLWRDRVPNVDKALAALKEAQDLGAPDLGPIVLGAQVLDAAGRWEPLVALLGELVKQLNEAPDLVATYHRLARIIETKLGQDDRALQVHERVLELEASNGASLHAVGRIHHRAGRWQDMIACYKRQLEHATAPDEQASLCYRIGRVYERKLGRRDDAVQSYEEALKKSARYAPAFRALDRILRRDRQWARLLEVLGAQAEAARTPIERAQLHHAMGQILELHLRDLPGAERAYGQAVKSAPTYEAAVAALGQVAEARGDHAALDAHYGELLNRTSDANARAGLLVRLGLLCELRRKEPGRAARLYREALEMGPLGKSALLGELRATRLDAGPRATVRPLHRVGARTTDPRLQHGYRTLAAIRDDVSAERPSATLFPDASALAQGDPLVTDGLIRALLRQASREAANLGLPDALVERAQACASGPAKSLLLLEAAVLFDRMRKLRDAALAYEDAGRAVPDFLPVLRGIRRIAAMHEQWQPVAAFLAREAEVSASLENRAAAFLAAGEIAVDRLNDPQGAIAHYRRLLEQDTAHETAYLRATLLYERTGDYAGLHDLLGLRAQAVSDPEARAVLLRRQAELLRDKLGEPGGAVATLKQALSVHPDDVDAYLMLAPLEEQQEWWQDAAECWRQIGRLTAGTETSRTARLREAAIRERELGDREAARLILEELIVDPEDREAALQMAQLCERMGQFKRARELYEQLAEGAEAEERASLLVSLATVLEGGFGDKEGAALALDEAFAVAVAEPRVVKQLEQRFGALGDWKGFVAAGERAFGKARVVAGPQSALHVALARVYSEELRRPDLASRHLAAAAELAPHDPGPTLALARLHTEGGRSDLGLALSRRALDIDPFHADALRELGRALIREGVPDAGQMLEDLAHWLKNGERPERPLGSRPVRRPVAYEELAAMMPRAHQSSARGVAEMCMLLEPFAPALLVESTGRIPRGDELPEANGVALRCRAVSQALMIEPLRVFVDPPDGGEAKLVADTRLALCIGKTLTHSSEQGRLIFEVTRQLWWVANRATIGAVAEPGGGELTAILQAIVTEEGPEPLRDLRRRVLKPIPRRVRKDAERIAIERLPDLPRDVATWHAEESRWADRLALLLCRDPVAALETMCEDPDQARQNPRAADLVRFLAIDVAWRAYLRLVSA